MQQLIGQLKATNAKLLQQQQQVDAQSAHVHQQNVAFHAQLQQAGALVAQLRNENADLQTKLNNNNSNAQQQANAQKILQQSAQITQLESENAQLQQQLSSQSLQVHLLARNIEFLSQLNLRLLGTTVQRPSSAITK